MAKGRFSGLNLSGEELVERLVLHRFIKGQVDVVLPDVGADEHSRRPCIQKSPGDFGDRRVGQPPQEEPSRGCFI